MRALRSIVFAFLMTLFLSAGGVFASGVVKMPPRPAAQAVRAIGPIKIDGRLDEPSWKLAPAASGFTQRYPKPGAHPSFKTSFRVLYDNKNLYIGVTCYDPEPSKIVRRMARRDREIPTDAVEMDIDSMNTGRDAVMLRLTSSGTRIDAKVYNEFHENDQWDCIWSGKSTVNSRGWTAELAIPFSQLRFTLTKDMVFGFEIRRDIERLQESDQWAYIPPNTNRNVSAYGTITGIKDVKAGSRLELTPFVVFSNRIHTREPFYHRGLSFNAGLDFKMPLNNSFTLTGTINPDFGQVEQDEVVLNLSTYETFYPEKRPFFMEGFQIFSPSGGMRLLHTRRIGTPPYQPWPEAGGKVVSAPEQTTILGAAKVTGTTAGGFTFGAFSAVTQLERATLVDSNGRSYREMTAPQTTYSVLRLAQNFSDNSSIGFMGTQVDRQEQNGRDANVGALTWNLSFKKNRDIVQGILARSSISGAGNDYDGIGATLTEDHVFNDLWTSFIAFEYYEPDFDINDLGFLRRSDYKLVSASVNRRQTTPTKRFLRTTLGFHVNAAENFEGDVLSRGGNVFYTAILPNYLFLFAAAGWNPSTYDDRESRLEGLLFRRKPAGWFSTSFGTDDRKKVAWSGSLDLRQENRGSTWSLSTGPSGHPTDRSQFSLDIGYTRTTGDYRWADMVYDNAGKAHSIFGNLDSRTFDLTARASYVFTPDLTLDLYTQLFDAAGHYDDFSELEAPSRFAPFSYAENPDYHFAAMNVNLVGRWEYKPGCTVYAVFSHGQTGGVEFDRFSHGAGMSPRRDFTLLTSAPRDDVFLIKLAYRF